MKMSLNSRIAISFVVCFAAIVILSTVEAGITSVGFLENYPVTRVKRSCGGGCSGGSGCGCCQPPPIAVQVCPPKCCCQQQSCCPPPPCCCQPKCCCCPPPPPPPVIKIQTCCPPSPPPCCCGGNSGGCGNGGGCSGAGGYSGGRCGTKARARARGLGLRPQGPISYMRQANPTLSSVLLPQQPKPMMPLKAKAMAPKQKGFGAMPAYRLQEFEQKSKNTGAGRA